MGEVCVERRRFERYPVYCPVQYRAQNSEPRDSSITINISEGGALLSTRNIVDVASELILKIFLKNRDFFLRARVVHIQKGDSPGLYNIGVEFLEKPIEFVRNLYEEMECIMLFQRRYSESQGREVSLAEASMQWYSDVPGWQM